MAVVALRIDSVSWKQGRYGGKKGLRDLERGAKCRQGPWTEVHEGSIWERKWRDDYGLRADSRTSRALVFGESFPYHRIEGHQTKRWMKIEGREDLGQKIAKAKSRTARRATRATVSTARGSS